ncbi:MAG: hypothetical protein Q9225_006886 [Loekoesia sp. 1 TL-2023]
MTQSSATGREPNGQRADRVKPKPPPMLEQYLREKDPWKEFLARPAEQNIERRQHNNERQSNNETNAGRLTGQGGTQRGTLLPRQ